VILGRDGISFGDSFRPGDRRFAILSIAAIAAVFIVIYVVAYVATSDRVPRNTTVAGVEIGGMSPAAAEAELTEQLGPRAEQPLTVHADGQKVRLDPAQAGLSFDVEATVDNAGGGRSLNPLRMLQVLAGGDEVEPVIVADEAALDRALTRVATRVDQGPIEGRITFSGARPAPRYPRTGLAVDTEASVEPIEGALLAEDRAVDLVVDTVDPEITKEAVDEGMDSFARPAVSGPVVLTAPGRSVVVQPRIYAPALSMMAEDGSLKPKVDEKVLRKRMQRPLSRLTTPPVDATVVLRNGTPTVVEGRPGTAVRTQALLDRFLPAVTATGDERAIALRAKVAPPEFTTQDARDLRIREVVSSFTTYFPHADYRNVNLSRAAEKISGTVLRPDEVFSLNGIVGERTAANGFTRGYIIDDGVLVEDFGGGVSQVATTTYNAAFFAGLKDIEHKPHSFYISRYPKGREATVVWGALDLKFQNDTPYGVLVEAWVVPSTPSTQGEMHVRMWSTQYWDRIGAGVSKEYNPTEPEVRYITDKNCEEQVGYGGFDVDVFRYFYRAGEKVRTEEWKVRYSPADTVRCGPPPRTNTDAPDGT
jgi:vancomycin resistance protein YoaR